MRVHHFTASAKEKNKYKARIPVGSIQRQIAIASSNQQQPLEQICGLKNTLN
jgi:hypothetical protein